MVSLEELLMSQVVQQEALTRLLDVYEKTESSIWRILVPLILLLTSSCNPYRLPSGTKGSL